MGTNTPSPDTINSVPICKTCASEHVVRDAWACFNRESGLWELENVYDDAHCHQCEASTKIAWVPVDTLENRRIRALNDQFRQTGKGTGTVVVTSPVQDLGDAALAEIVCAVQNFAAFDADNDPWGEHDSGSFVYETHKLYFKIDYYDPTLKHGSENPANEVLTHRVLTIMLASEY